MSARLPMAGVSTPRAHGAGRRRDPLGSRRIASVARDGEDGQSLMITALFALVLALVIMVSFAIGQRYREKIKMQALADASAYSLAVSEARAMNYLALTNRAIVSHMVAVLSVHAHESYMSWYEYFLLSQGKVWTDIARLFETRGEECYWQIWMGKHFRNVFWYFGVGGTVDNPGPGSWKYTHRRWHRQHDQWCNRMIHEGHRNHMEWMVDLRNQQRAVIDATRARARSAAFIGDLASRADGKVTANAVTGPVNETYVSDSVIDNDSVNANHGDLSEVLSGTRYPSFLTDRWYKIPRRAQQLDDRNCRISNDLSYAYFSSTMRRICQRGLAIDWINNAAHHPTEADLEAMSVAEYSDEKHDQHKLQQNSNQGQLVQNVWGSAKGVDAVGANPSAVARAVENSELGQASAAAGEDHGEYYAALIHTWEHTHSPPADPWWAPDAKRDKVDDCKMSAIGMDWQERGASTSKTAAGDAYHSYFSHSRERSLSQAAGEWRLIEAIDTSMLYPRGHSNAGTFYRGHVYFNLINDPDRLWNMPRTVALLERPAGQDNRPWDFDLGNARLPFQLPCLSTRGCRVAGQNMQAIASGLVYYHKPELAAAPGLAYKEPPSLWNPFWRAKLHPLRARDAERIFRVARADDSMLNF